MDKIKLKMLVTLILSLIFIISLVYEVIAGNNSGGLRSEYHTPIWRFIVMFGSGIGAVSIFISKDEEIE